MQATAGIVLLRAKILNINARMTALEYSTLLPNALCHRGRIPGEEVCEAPRRKPKVTKGSSHISHTIIQEERRNPKQNEAQIYMYIGQMEQCFLSPLLLGLTCPSASYLTSQTDEPFFFFASLDLFYFDSCS